MPDALCRLLRRAARVPADPVAVASDGVAVTAAALAGRVAGLAARFAPGAVLGVLAEDGPDWMVAALAARAAGATLVPLPLFFTDAQLGDVAADAGVAAIAASPSQAARAAALGRPCHTIDGRAADPAALRDHGGALIAYTSGTTGRPKGALIGADAVDIKALTLVAACGAGPADRYLSVLPMSLLLELLCAVHVVLMAEARVVFAPRGAGWSAEGAPRLLDALERAAPTVSVLVPALLGPWVGILEATGRRAPSSLRLVAVGGAPVGEGLAERAWRVGLPVHEGYGLTECCSVVALNRPGERMAGTVGRPLPGVAVTIEEGEIVVADPSLMAGYLHGEPPPRRWRTGDLGHLDAAGRLVVTGRRDDVIVTALGRNLSPGWPEGLALADPAMAHCAVFLADGEACAVVEPAAGPAADVRAAAAHRWSGLPAYARPRLIDAVPAGTFRGSGWLRPDGAVDRRAVAAAYRAVTAFPKELAP